ncbi:hypothetical protein ACT7C6_14885 [Bacillus paranthracis]
MGRYPFKRYAIKHMGERTIAMAISSTSFHNSIIAIFDEFSFDFISEDVAEVVEDKPKKEI